jgi:nicotinamidase/pyrazinamidase
MKALVLVDIQNDFVPGGALPVPEGDHVVPVANRLMKKFDLVVATQDWHPRDHRSFASQHKGKSVGDIIDLDGLEQILWPDHCIQNTQGAEFVAELNTNRIDYVIQNGTDPMIDSYSGFFDNAHRKATGLHDFLQQKGVDEVVLAGLATDYCVKFTALDALQLGYKTIVVREGIRGIEMNEGDCEKAIEDMKAAGAVVTKSR